MNARSHYFTVMHIFLTVLAFFYSIKILEYLFKVKASTVDNDAFPSNTTLEIHIVGKISTQ